METSQKNLIRTRKPQRWYKLPRWHGRRLRHLPRFIQPQSGLGEQALLERQSIPDADPTSTACIDAGVEPSDVLDVLNRVEDMMSRLSRICPGYVRVDGNACLTLGFAGFEHGVWEGDALALRYAVMDTQNYRWSQDGVNGSLVQFLDYQRGDLVISFAALQSLGTLPEGDYLAGQMREFMTRFLKRGLPC